MPDFAAYYFPFGHCDPANEKLHGKGWTEWELTRTALPRFQGHRQPRTPLWGYQDEADPEVMYAKGACASSYGLDAFIFDWYWYAGKPFLVRALEEGFLGSVAPPLKFALMWANHDWSNMHPVSYWQAKSGHVEPIYKASVSIKQFENLCHYIVEKYFNHTSYWKIEDAPYFSIYNLAEFLRSFGGMKKAADALDYFRSKAKEGGHPHIHLNAVEIHTPNIPHEEGISEWKEVVRYLGFDSVTSYSWAHFTNDLLINGGTGKKITYTYRDLDHKIESLWKKQREKYQVPFFPHVTVGWDSSPRTVQSDKWENMGSGPFSYIWNDAEPTSFERYLKSAANFSQQYCNDSPVIINAWNEWPESSYLEPDTEFQYEYLEALSRVAEQSYAKHTFHT